MMNIFTVSFFGHRILANPVTAEERLERLIFRLLREKEYVEFLVGRSGDFDILVSSVVHRAKRAVRDDNSALVLVLPYPTAECLNNEEFFHQFYDEIEICSSSASAYYKSAIQIRNKDMADRSDLVAVYVERNSGGAYSTMKYAQKRKHMVLNLAGDAEVLLF